MVKDFELVKKISLLCPASSQGSKSCVPSFGWPVTKWIVELGFVSFFGSNYICHFLI
jgi:hypothetical protein